MKYKFKGKFYVGIVLIVLSFLIGNYAKLLFLLHWNEPTTRNWMIFIYLLTWPILALGIWWVGKEYADAVRRYTSYKFYHEQAKRGAKKAVAAGKAGVGRAVSAGKKHSKRVVESSKKVHARARESTRKVVARGKQLSKKVRKK